MCSDLTITDKPIYSVATPVFEGPLDLLLQLIERTELDITKLVLSQVTDQFLSYLRELKESSANEISSFLVIAARLMQIKSEALLPHPPERDPGEEDPGEALIQQLLVYRRYKKIAAYLGNREVDRLHTYLRLRPPMKVEGKLDFSDIHLSDLLAAAQHAFLIKMDKEPLSKIVNLPRVTIKEKILLITQALRKNKKTTFRELLGNNQNRTNVIVTFLALLELIKRYMIDAKQEIPFGDIELEPLEQFENSLEIDTEFID